MTVPKRVALSDVAVIEREIVDSTAIETGTLYVGLENIESGGRFVGVRPVDAGELASSKFAFTPQHLLYGKLRPYLAKIARPDFQGICSADILPVLPGADLDRSYLAWLLLTPEMVALANSRATGANLPRLSPTALAELRIPLPPLPEQRRIAEILDKADALRAKRRAALAQLDTLTQSIFLDMFGDPATNPKGWPEVTVADICEVKGGKRLPKGEEYSSFPTPFRYIRVTDLQFGAVNESALVYLKPEIQAEIARYIVSTGDVIISIAGSIGLIAPVPASLDGANLTENAAKLVPRAKGVYDAVFLAALLQMPFARGQILSHVGQVTIGKLALFRIEKITLQLPPLEAQHRFTALVDIVARQKAAQQEAHAELHALFGALQHRAFRGDL